MTASGVLKTDGAGEIAQARSCALLLAMVRSLDFIPSMIERRPLKGFEQGSDMI